MVRRLCVAVTAFLLFIGLAGAAYAFTVPWRTAYVSWAPRGGYPVVTNLRVGEHQNFDRVVLDIKGRVPGGHASYVRHLVYDGSGAPVPLTGRYKFRVVLHPARSHDLTTGANLYQGPRLRQVNLPMLRGVASTGDFEGYRSFGFTLREKTQFRVFSLHNPQRVVLDFHH